MKLLKLLENNRWTNNELRSYLLINVENDNRKSGIIAFKNHEEGRNIFSNINDIILSTLPNVFEIQSLMLVYTRETAPYSENPTLSRHIVLYENQHNEIFYCETTYNFNTILNDIFQFIDAKYLTKYFEHMNYVTLYLPTKYAKEICQRTRLVPLKNGQLLETGNVDTYPLRYVGGYFDAYR